jgi:hypothetical protein
MFYSQRSGYLGDPPEFSAKRGSTAKVGLGDVGPLQAMVGRGLEELRLLLKSYGVK